MSENNSLPGNNNCLPDRGLNWEIYAAIFKSGLYGLSVHRHANRAGKIGQLQPLYSQLPFLNLNHRFLLCN